LSFDLTGAVSVVTTEQPATQTGDAGGESIGRPSIKSKDGRKLNQFIFHSPVEKGQKLTKAQRVSDLVAAGYSKADASKMAEESSSNFFVIDENGDLKFAADSDYDLKVSYSVVWEEITYVEEPDPIVEGATVTTEVKTPYMFFALDANDPWYSEQFAIAAGYCGIFKVHLETGDWSCVEKGYLAAHMDDNYRKAASDQKRKPLQIDAEGNVFFIGSKFAFDDDEDGEFDRTDMWWANNWENRSLRRVAAGESVARELTPDTDVVTSFMAMTNNTLSYTYYTIGDWDYQLGMLINTNQELPTTFDLAKNIPWGQFFYSADDANTLIYSEGEWNSDGINFAQAIPGTTDRLNLTLDTSVFSDNNWDAAPKRVILSDDGSIYGLFVTNEWNYITQENKYTGKIKRMLPFSTATYASFVIGYDWDDYWNFFDNGQRDVQVAKGYIFYIASEEHPTKGSRNVINIVRIVDGKHVKVLNDTDWLQRYEIYNWKLTGDTLYATGFDKLTSTSISAKLDTLKLKQGLGTSEYLIISETASVLGASNKIDDLELIRTSDSSEFSGGSPQVTRYFTDSENLYSASIEFSKYMDTESVEQATSVQHEIATSVDEDGNPIKEWLEVDVALKVWLNKTMHMVFDTNLFGQTDGQYITDPLYTDTDYKIIIDGDLAMDKDGFELSSGGSTLEWAWSTIPSEGWYTGKASPIQNITDGKVGKFVYDPQNSWESNQSKVRLATVGYPLNHKVEVSMPAKAFFRTELSLRDSHVFDWSSSTSSPQGTSFTWNWYDGFQVTSDKTYALEWSEDRTNTEWKAAWGWYQDRRLGTPIINDCDGDDVDDENCYVLDTANADSVKFVRVPYHHVDASGNLWADAWIEDPLVPGKEYFHRRNLGTDPLHPVSDGQLVREEQGHYLRDGVKYFWSENDFGDWDYYSADGTLMDYSGEYGTDYVWVDWGWIDVDTDERVVLTFDWRSDYWLEVTTDGETESWVIPTIDLDDTVWQWGYYASDVNDDGSINLYGLCAFDGVDGDCSTDFGSEAGTQWSFTDGDWNWEPDYTVDTFVENVDNDWHWFNQVEYGGSYWGANDRMDMRLLNENPDWFDHNWDLDNPQFSEGWSKTEWIKLEYHYLTDQETGDTTVTVRALDTEGNVLPLSQEGLITIDAEVSKTLYLDVEQASWKVWSTSEDEAHSSLGFNIDLRVFDGPAVLDNIRVIDMTGETDVVLMEETFDDAGQNIFNRSAAASDQNAVSSLRRAKETQAMR
jgi:hypothetical protein